MKRYVVLMVVVSLCVGSALGLVYARHQSRKHFYELEALESERDRLDTEWGRLQIEQSTLASHGRVERMAGEKLKMHQPDTDEVVYVKKGVKQDVSDR